MYHQCKIQCSYYFRDTGSKSNNDIQNRESQRFIIFIDLKSPNIFAESKKYCQYKEWTNKKASITEGHRKAQQLSIDPDNNGSDDVGVS